MNLWFSITEVKSDFKDFNVILLEEKNITI